MMEVIAADDGGRRIGQSTAPHLQCLTGAIEAKALPTQPHNISKHGFGFFPEEVIATAFTSSLFGVVCLSMTSPSQSTSTGLPGEERNVFSLSKVTRAVEKMLDERAGGTLFWVKAEISQFRISGKHAYVGLVEERSGRKVAQLEGRIWGERLVQIRKELGAEFDEVLKPGREIVFSAYMAFHAVWGFSLNIQRIDLDALLGEMERRRKETLEALQREGAIGRNGRIRMPDVVQRIVLIGSVGTAGHTDFLTHLSENAWGYRLDVGLIDANVQGAAAAPSLVKSLHRAGRLALRGAVDAVVVLRGGGAKLDLDAFNDLSLCRTVAAMDIPVVVGIGHETDQTLVDAVAHTACKTPTAVADFLLERMAEFEGRVSREGRAIAAESRAQLSEQTGWMKEFKAVLKERPRSKVQLERGALYTGANGVVRRTRSALATAKTALEGGRVALDASRHRPGVWKGQLDELQAGMVREVARHVRQQQERVESMRQTLDLLGPEATLKRGFSITRLGGESIRDTRQLEVGDAVQTQLELGTFTSVVTEIAAPTKDD